MEAVAVGCALSGLADASVPADWAGAAVAQGLLLDVHNATAVGRCLRKEQTRSCAQTIADSMAWLYMRSALVCG